MRCVKKITRRKENKMKYKIFAGLMVIMLAGCSTMKGDPVAIDGKHILVTDVSEPGFFNSKIHSNIMKGGVYIIAGSVDNRFPNAEKAMAEMFKANGIAVADSLETASVAIVVNTMLALDMASADRQAANSAMPNASQVASGGGQLIGAVLSGARSAAGGGGGLVGFVAGALFNTDSKLLILVTAYKKPVYRKGFAGRGVGSDSKDSDAHAGAVAKIFFKLEKGKEAPDDVVLKMAMDQWIKHYVIFDSLPQSPVAKTPEPVSAVVAAETMDKK